MYRPKRTKKDLNHKEIVSQCRELGMVVWDTADLGGKVLDIIVFWKGKAVPVEIKSEGNENDLTDSERSGIEELKFVGVKAVIATRIEDILEQFKGG